MLIRRVLYLVLALLALGALGYLVYSLFDSAPKSKLEGVDVSIVKRDTLYPLFMNEEDILREMQEMGLDYTGQSIDSIDLAELQGALRKNPLFKQAEVYIASRSRRMKVEVEQCRASFLVQAADSSYYVTEDRAIVPLNTEYAIYVPVVSGHLSKEFAKTKLYDLVSAIQADDYFRHYFGHYYVDEQEGIILTPRVGTARIIFGFEGDWAYMLSKLRSFDEEIIPRKGWNAFEYLKLGYGDQVVAKERS